MRYIIEVIGRSKGRTIIMSKTLSIILTVFKVAKIVAKVVFILCIVGGVGCLISLATLPFLGGIIPAEMLTEEGLDLPSTLFASLVGVIACTGEAICAFFAEKYFGLVLEAKTPFTFDGSKKCFNLGLISIITSLAVSVASGIILGIGLLIYPNTTGFEAETSISLSTGLFFLFMSLIFKHGAETQASDNKTAEHSESYEESTHTEQL